MSITREVELIGMKKASEAVAYTSKEMRAYAQPGMTTKQLDNYGAAILSGFGARSAPLLTYRFPGRTCISVNNEFCHGIPSHNRTLKEGDLVNIDVSAELAGFWSDNGGSFVLGEDINGHQKLVDASKQILYKALYSIKGGVRISDIGHLIETEAKKRGYKVIKNLTGHGIGKSLHEEPNEIANYKDRFNPARFKKASVIAVETFITTTSTYAETLADGWTMVGNKRAAFIATTLQINTWMLGLQGFPVVTCLMAKQKNSPTGIVYSTNPEYLNRFEEVPQDAFTLPKEAQKLRVKLDTRQRAGKVVTLVEGFVGKTVDLEALGKELKTKCGAGGSVKDGVIMIQGNYKEQVTGWLKGWGYAGVK